MVVDEDMTQAAQRGEIALESVQGQMTMEIENVKVGRKEEERGAEGERGTDPDAVEDEEGMVVDEDVNQGDTVSNTVEPRQGEASLEIQMVVVEDPNSGDILPNNPQPGQEEAPMEIEEVVNRVAADKVLVKQEPTTSVLLRDTLHGKSKALPEIIDLTLDSDDDEDVAPPRPLITSRTSAPAPPRHCPSQGTESTRTGPSYDMSDHPVPMDIDPVAVDPQPEPSTHLHRQEADPHPGASSSGVRRAAPASAPTLVKPSLAGHFRIVGTDCDYSNTRLREVVLHNDGGTELGSWATILAHLQLLPGGKGPASPPMADPVSVERWSEIYEALRDYYLWYLAPSSDAEPPLANNSEGSVDTIADAMTVDVPSERGICPVTDAAETPSLQLPSSSLGESGIERHIPRVGILLDPATCRSIFAVDKIKAEEIISDGPPPPRQLNRTHKELLFPLCDQELECSSCQVQSGEPESACKYPTTTSLEVLSAHMEEVHSEVLDLLFAQTEGMDDDEIRRWWLEDSD
ncbi:hypothetical protein C8R46DRAFT_1080951 [Mycena filopes]|nr:hypothetical protein C8R46DRAFT_1080951 [Mycena filopes]